MQSLPTLDHEQPSSEQVCIKEVYASLQMGWLTLEQSDHGQIDLHETTAFHIRDRKSEGGPPHPQIPTFNQDQEYQLHILHSHASLCHSMSIIISNF